jgi:hypothetical protein
MQKMKKEIIKAKRYQAQINVARKRKDRKECWALRNPHFSIATQIMKPGCHLKVKALSENLEFGCKTSALIHN